MHLCFASYVHALGGTDAPCALDLRARKAAHRAQQHMVALRLLQLVPPWPQLAKFD